MVRKTQGRNRSVLLAAIRATDQSGRVSQPRIEEGYTIDQIYNLTKIDPWFLEKLKNIYDYSSTLQERSKELELLNTLSEENLRLQDRERFLSNQLIRRTKILNDLKASPKFLDYAHWEEVKEAIDWLYENYTKLRIGISGATPPITDDNSAYYRLHTD